MMMFCEIWSTSIQVLLSRMLSSAEWAARDMQPDRRNSERPFVVLRRASCDFHTDGQVTNKALFSRCMIVLTKQEWDDSAKLQETCRRTSPQVQVSQLSWRTPATAPGSQAKLV